MKNRLPKEIRVGTKRYAVVRKAKNLAKVGRIDYEDGTIAVAVHDSRGVPLSAQEQHEVFWHEMTHGILNDMGHPLRDNERFVTAFAKRLNKAIFSAKF
jgi:hypothetical protein